MTRRESPSDVTRRILATRFPNCFAGKGEPKWPLAIGIHQQVFDAAPDLSKRSVRAALHNYIHGPKYLSNMVVGAIRLNLDGSAAGIVTAADAAHAVGRLRKLEKIWYQQRVQRRAAKAALKKAA